jgi:membrane protease YdiL (CAAX protease family)
MILSRVFHQSLNARQMVWIIYLLGISIAEEWVFRLALPGFVAGFIGIPRAVLVCNLVFAGLHYFTLRWKLRWCLGAFFGAMGLSRLMGQGDLLLVIGVHWLATFLNTPVAVGSREKRASLPSRPVRADEE